MNTVCNLVIFSLYDLYDSVGLIAKLVKLI